MFSICFDIYHVFKTGIKDEQIELVNYKSTLNKQYDLKTRM